MTAIENTFKVTMPLFLFFFCRRFIRSKEDLHGVFVTFLYSAVFVIIILGYELIFNPISVQVSRGLERIQGHFADVSNYAIYSTCGLLIAGYIFFDKKNKWELKKRTIIFIATLAVSLLIITNIHHTASYVVVLALLFLFVLSNLGSNIGGGILIGGLIFLLIYLFGKDAIEDNFLKLVETDIKVYEGEKGNEALLHGRVGRWQHILQVFSDTGIFSHWFGITSEFKEPYNYISKGAHNDFIRILMFSGYTGLIIYLILLFNIFKRSFFHNTPMKFLGLGTLAIIFLYSISTTPTLYAPLLYVLIPVICMLALPKKMMN